MPPNEVILNDNIERQNKLLDNLTNFLEKIYFQTQEEEGNKQPRNIRPYTANISLGTGSGALALQVMPRNPSRYDFAAYNLGPGDIIWCNTVFDPNSILQQFSDPAHPNVFLPAPNQVVQIGLIPSGATVDVNGQEPLWVFNVGGNAVLTIIETVFAKPGSMHAAGFPIPGLDGAIGAGYGTVDDVDGNPTLVKGIR